MQQKNNLIGELSAFLLSDIVGIDIDIEPKAGLSTFVVAFNLMVVGWQGISPAG